MAHRASLFVVVAAFLSVSCNAFAQNEPTSLEMVQLPAFCWAQFHVPNAEGDRFRIRDCGPSANHYCYALMYMLRAKGPKLNKRGRLDLLGHANADIRYTEGSIKDYPSCSIRNHIQGSKVELSTLWKAYGGQGAGPK